MGERDHFLHLLTGEPRSNTQIKERKTSESGGDKMTI